MTYRAHVLGQRRQRMRSKRQRRFWAWVDRMGEVIKRVYTPPRAMHANDYLFMAGEGFLTPKVVKSREELLALYPPRDV